MKPTIILLNGPPGSGKDTAALHIREQFNRSSLPYPDCFLDRFSMPNKRAFAATVGAYCSPDGIVQDWEEIKNDPHILLNGRSYRNWQQDFSERFMKPLYGEDIFARLLINRIHDVVDEDCPNAFFVIPDSGFQVEVDALARMRDIWDMHLIRITERGTYEGDTREFVEPFPGMPFTIIPNKGSESTFKELVATTIGFTWKDKLNA